MGKGSAKLDVELVVQYVRTRKEGSAKVGVAHHVMGAKVSLPLSEGFHLLQQLLVSVTIITATLNLLHVYICTYMVPCVPRDTMAYLVFHH